MPYFLSVVLYTSIALSMFVPVKSIKADEVMGVQYLHTMVGSLDIGEAWTISDARGDITGLDGDELLYGGGSVHLSHKVGVLQYGLETGGLIAFKNDADIFARSDEDGDTAAIEIENRFLLIDLSLGGFVSLRPWRGFRVYASAGPAIMIGTMSIDEDDVELRQGNGSDIGFMPKGRENDVDVGVYARVGIDIMVDGGFIVGASARKVDGELNFDNLGVVELDEVQYFLTLGWAF